MRVLIVGGYGLFGGRLGQLLLRDGCEVIVAGRDQEKAGRWTSVHGGEALRLDREGDLGPILTARADALVDAAGPFQAYAADDYRLARYCIANGIDYLDLSDDAAFTAGIGALDAVAKAAGRFALSGVSSAPALSSAVVAELAEDLQRLDLIDAAIFPGAKAARGRSIVAAVLSQVGGPVRIWRGNAWREALCWDEPRDYNLQPEGPRRVRRRAQLMSVPDLALFPARFGARAVTFRAGLALGAQSAAISLFALLRRAEIMDRPERFTDLARRLARLVEPFGSDRGGMVVTVVGAQGSETVERTWRLVAEAGQGPFIPTIAARALLRRAGTIAPGARACLDDLTLQEAEAAMSDLDVATTRGARPRPPLFKAALGEAVWRDLPAAVRKLHRVQDVEGFAGRARIDRGGGVLARLAAWVFGFPRAAEDAPVRVTISRIGDAEVWERTFAGRTFRSRLSPANAPGRIKERFGLLTFELDLPLTDSSLLFNVRRGWCLGVRLPRFALPRSETREFEEVGVFHFDVGLHAPFGAGLIVRYRGWLKRDQEEPSATP